MPQEKITSFTGKYYFLSNFYPCIINYEGIDYTSSEHAYVAAKTLDVDIKKYISNIKTPGQVKKFGISLQLREDWEEVKVSEMRKILEIKFSPNRIDEPLLSMLEETAPSVLVEGNTWGDVFWGQCPIGNGKNMLGKLLMNLRDDISRKFG